MDAKPEKKKSSRRRGKKKKSKIADRWNPTTKEVQKTEVEDLHGDMAWKGKGKAPPKKEMSMMQKNLLKKKGEGIKDKRAVITAIPEEEGGNLQDVGKLESAKLKIEGSPAPPPSSANRKVGKLEIKEATPEPEPEPEPEEPEPEPEETPEPEPIDEEDFFSHQEDIIVDDNRVIPDRKEGVDYTEDLHLDQDWLKAASRVPPEQLKDWLEPYSRAKYIIFEFAQFSGDNAKTYSSILGTFACMTFNVEGLYFYHVATGLSNSSSFIRHCREFIAMNHKTLRELVFNTVGHCYHFFIKMPVLPKLEMVSFSIVDLDENAFKMLAKQPNLKHLCIAGGHGNDFQNEDFLTRFFATMGSRLVTLGLEDPHITSSVELFETLLSSLPNLRLLAVKHWIGGNADGSGGGREFTGHIANGKYGGRLTRKRPAALDEMMGDSESMKWWEYTDDWKIRVLEAAAS